MTLLDVVAQKARVAGLVAAACAVTGVATAAAVAPAFSNVDSSTEVVATASPSASPPASLATEDDPAVTTQATAAPATSASPKPCPSDVANHGGYVSSVAKDRSTTGREHGMAVSEAARSDCGKPTSATDEPSESPEASESPKADKDRAHKHGKAKGHHS